MIRLLLLAIVVASVAIGCGDSPTAPSANNVPCAPNAHRQYDPNGVTFVCAPN